MEKEEEDEPDPAEQEAQPPDEPRGIGTTRGRAGGDLAQAYEIDPESSSVDQQALFYDALLEEVDRHTEEAERALLSKTTWSGGLESMQYYATVR